MWDQEKGKYIGMVDMQDIVAYMDKLLILNDTSLNERGNNNAEQLIAKHFDSEPVTKAMSKYLFVYYSMGKTRYDELIIQSNLNLDGYQVIKKNIKLCSSLMQT